MMQRFFIFIQCSPGKAQQLGMRLAKEHLKPIKEINSISGKWDLLLRVEIDNRLEVSREVIDQIFRLGDIKKTKTVVAYQIFDPQITTVDDDFD